MLPLDTLRQRKIGQWTVAYVAVAWGTLQLLDFLAGHFAWPAWMVRAATIFLIVNILNVLILAWHHGEKGRQRVSIGEAVSLAIVLAAALGGAWIAARRTTMDSYATSVQRDVSESSVAVLPFKNHGTADNAYFSDGITEEILDAVAKIPGLRVAARTSSFAFREQEGNAIDIARKLGVAHLLMGSVQREGVRVRVTSQLVVASKDSTIWSQSFDSNATDLFAVEDSISAAIAQQLRMKIVVQSGGDSTRAVSDSAHDLYLLGRDRWAQRTIPSITQAIQFFTQSIHAAPNWAPAHAGLALALAVYPNYKRDGGDDTIFARAEAEAHRALELDSTNDEAYAALSEIAQYYRDDMKAGEAYAKKAIALNPNNATAHQWLAEVYWMMGRLDDALAEINVALNRDPLSPVMLAERGAIHAARGEWEQGLQDEYATLKIDATFNAALTDGLQIALATKRYDVARTMARGISPQVAASVDSLVLAFRDANTRSAFLAHLPHDIGGVISAELLGDRDRAIGFLQEADRHDVPAYYFAPSLSSPAMKGLREDPRCPRRYRWPAT